MRKGLSLIDFILNVCKTLLGYYFAFCFAVILIGAVLQFAAPVLFVFDFISKENRFKNQ